MRLAVPKEILPGEKRVAAIPETVEKYRKLGFDVRVEAGAGEGIFFSDDDYRRAGATVVADVEALLADAELILKVKQPIYNDRTHKHEVEMMPRGSTLVTFLHPAAPECHAMVHLLRERRILSFTMDGIPRISRAQRMDALTSMSTVTGYRAVLDAARCLPRFLPMIGTAIGMIKPATVLVVGTGVVGLQAIATAKRLGAVVKAWDIREAARKEAASLGAKVEGFEVPPELALAPGGYARALPAQWLEKERRALAAVAREADILILCALVPGSLAPVLISHDTVVQMRPGSVIVDVSVDQGGNCADTHAGREIVENGVHVCGVANIPGSMAVHASWLYAHNMLHYVENLFKNGKIDFDDEIVKATTVTRDDRIVFGPALEAMAQHEVALAAGC